MSVKLEEYEGVCVLSVTGNFVGSDVLNARKLSADLIERRGVCDFVIDLERAVFIDSDGLQALLWIKKRCEDLFGQFKLAAAGEVVKKILEVTRLGCRFVITPDVSAALKTMR